MASWQAYIDTSLVGTGQINKAAIVSVAGDSTWASSAGFTIGLPEMKVIATIYNNDEAAKTKAFADGIYIAGERYVVARIDERSIYARKGKEGIAIAKTKQTMLFGHHDEVTQAGNASAAVEKLADYLISLGY